MGHSQHLESPFSLLDLLGWLIAGSSGLQSLLWTSQLGEGRLQLLVDVRETVWRQECWHLWILCSTLQSGDSVCVFNTMDHYALAMWHLSLGVCSAFPFLSSKPKLFGLFPIQQSSLHVLHGHHQWLLMVQQADFLNSQFWCHSSSGGAGPELLWEVPDCPIDSFVIGKGRKTGKNFICGKDVHTVWWWAQRGCEVKAVFCFSEVV